MSRTPKELTGQRFGRLVALQTAGSSPNKSILWECQCDCGNTVIVEANRLRATGGKKSCGCLHAEANRVRAVDHGQSHTPIYYVWQGMIRRCTDLSHKSWLNYGGRGIKVCVEWRLDFQDFYKHVSTLPHFGEKGYSLDRIDNNGNYEPGNVQWSTRGEQQRNTGRNYQISYGGRTQCLKDWAIEVGLDSETLKSRIDAGWELSRALTTPARKLSKSK